MIFNKLSLQFAHGSCLEPLRHFGWTGDTARSKGLGSQLWLRPPPPPHHQDPSQGCRNRVLRSTSTGVAICFAHMLHPSLNICHSDTYCTGHQASSIFLDGWNLERKRPRIDKGFDQEVDCFWVTELYHVQVGWQRKLHAFQACQVNCGSLSSVFLHWVPGSRQFSSKRSAHLTEHVKKWHCLEDACSRGQAKQG